MTRNELRARKEAAVAAYYEGNTTKGAEIVLELCEKWNRKKLYRFRPANYYEIQAIKGNKIYMCRPSKFEDADDCKWYDDIQELAKYHVAVDETGKYNRIQNSDNNELFRKVENLILDNEKYIDLRAKTRKMCLVSCFSDRISDYMWKKYADNCSGMCLEYDLVSVIEKISQIDGLKIFPVWYVEDRKRTPEIKFGVREYTDDTGNLMIQKYILSCMTKNKIPFSQESEWRLFCENTEIPFSEDSKEMDFINPDKIIIGEKMNADFEKSLIAVAEEMDISVCY